MPGPFDIDALRAALAGQDLSGWTPPDQVPPAPGDPGWADSVRQRTGVADGSVPAPGPLGAEQPQPPPPSGESQTASPLAPLGRFAQGFTGPEAQQRTAHEQAQQSQGMRTEEQAAGLDPNLKYGSEQAVQALEQHENDLYNRVSSRLPARKVRLRLRLPAPSSVPLTRTSARPPRLSLSATRLWVSTSLVSTT